MSDRPGATIPSANARTGFEKRILQLVRSNRDRQAVQTGQIDAIIDPVSGRALLMPDAQASLLQRKARFRSLVELSTDGYWEQDENYRFVEHSGTAIGNAAAAGILGKTLWELAFDNGDQADWRTLRTQLEWRATFRDLEFRCVDTAGRLRTISLSGEPMFDRQDHFTGYRGITRDLTDRRLMSAAVPDSDRFARATLDALASRVCVLDAAGMVLTANTAWRQFAASHRGTAAGTAEGSNYLNACLRLGGPGGRANADDRAIADGVRQVIAGARDLFRYECPHEAAPGPGWSLATVTRVRGEDAARAIVSFEDISEIKRAENLLRLEYKVARTLATADPTAALSAVIRAVCESQHWDCGRYFRMDPAAGELSLDAAWGMPGPAVTHFIEQSRGVVIRPGAGLAGRVYEAGEPLWIADEGKDPRAVQAALAHELGMVGTLAFPVVAAAGTLGVLMFSSHSVVAPDERLLQATRAIGQQLGQFLQRHEAEERLRRNDWLFGRLISIASDWYWEQDAQFRFTSVVGAAMAPASEILGRTLWELPGVVVSESEWLRHRTEIEAHWSFSDFEYAVTQPDGALAWFRVSGEPAYDKAGAFCGFHGTGLNITRRKRAAAALPSGSVA